MGGDSTCLGRSPLLDVAGWVDAMVDIGSTPSRGRIVPNGSRASQSNISSPIPASRRDYGSAGRPRIPRLVRLNPPADRHGPSAARAAGAGRHRMTRRLRRSLVAVATDRYDEVIGGWSSAPIASPGSLTDRAVRGQLLEPAVDTVVEQLNEKLRAWRPEVAAIVRQRVLEIIDLADQDALDLMRSRAVEQEVLDLLDGPSSR